MEATTNSKPRRTLSQFPIYFLIFLIPYVLWCSLCAICHTSTPIVIVTSGSVEPVFRRGDILFVSNRTASIEVGDIVECWFEGCRLPFVHRVVEKHVLPAGVRANESLEKSSGERYGFLTKGDNSPLDDTVLYPLGQRYLFRRDIVGSVKGYVPYVGRLALLFEDTPWVKQAIVVSSAFFFICT